MDEAHSCDPDSVFALITRLCEQYTNNTQKVKKLRSKCYEILLKKRSTICINDFGTFDGTKDPMFNLAAWVFQLMHEFQMPNRAAEIKSWIRSNREEYEDNKELLYKPMQFLINLRNLPSRDTKKLDLSSLPPIEEHLNFNQMFKLPTYLLEEFDKSGDDTKNKKEDTADTNTQPSLGIIEEPVCSSSTSVPVTDIWDLVSKMEFKNRRTWESYGYPDPDKEKPFLSELGELSSLWVENLESLYIGKLFKNGIVFKYKTIPRKDFIKDLKHLLIGLASNSFQFNEHGEFYMIPDINIEGVTPDTLNKFCRNMIFCGTCVKALTRMSNNHNTETNYRHQGYIFKEFCEGISRYLQFHRAGVFTIPDTTNCLEFDKKTLPLQQKIETLASICKVTPTDGQQEEMPSGVTLLNYLYQKLVSLTDEKVMLVLCSILHACCQVYFSRFLIRWILEGVIEDAYGEFFIKSNTVKNKSRSYWSKGFSIRKDIIPDFLMESGMDILNCGKAMHLLRMCHNQSPLCLYLRGKRPLIISCCLTANQLCSIKQNTMHYYLEVSKDCGPKLDFDQVLLRPNAEDPALLRLVAQKKAATLRRLELERLKSIEEQRERKIEEIAILREQYETYQEQKQLNLVKEVQSEIEQIQEGINLEEKKEKLIKDEANKMIEFYTTLMDTADQKKLKIESQMKLIKNIQIDQCPLGRTPQNPTEDVTQNSNSSSDSFYSIINEVEKESTKFSDSENESESKMHSSESESKMHSSESMDAINANTLQEAQDINKTAMQQVIDNFEIAKKIKQKVMTEEMGIEYTPIIKSKTETTPDLPYLTAAQRNKLKVLSSEFGINIRTKIHQLSDQAQLNKNKVMGISTCFQLDNASFVNKNLKTVNEEPSDLSLKKSKSLTLDLNQTGSRSSRSATDKPIPMSVDSTPMSELPQSLVTTPSTTFLSIDTNQIESIPSTAESGLTNQTSTFNFNRTVHSMPTFSDCRSSSDTARLTVFSKRVTEEEAKGVSLNTLRLFLQECIQFPLAAQLDLVNQELLKYFVQDLSYFKHLLRLRDYFFLQDGEFAHSITDSLFTKLYNSNSPRDLMNFRTLQSLVFVALDGSDKGENADQRLSFKINDIPTCFDLGDPKVLECISLTYKVDFPLNIVLPSDTIGKYENVFKFLLKLNRVSWVLKRIFLELKILVKQVNTKKMYLLSSPHFRTLHQCRHMMTHFIQTLQNYIVGEVLQSSWEIFVRSLSDVKNVDELYAAHTSYIKEILFKCLLSQKMEVFRNVLHKIFTVILKFYDYSRSRSWILEGGLYLHPNFKQLVSIFKNFEELVAYFYRNVYKIAKCGYHPHLFQLLDALDVNNYISAGLRKGTA